MAAEIAAAAMRLSADPDADPRRVCHHTCVECLQLHMVCSLQASAPARPTLASCRVTLRALTCCLALLAQMDYKFPCRPAHRQSATQVSDGGQLSETEPDEEALALAQTAAEQAEHADDEPDHSESQQPETSQQQAAAQAAQVERADDEPDHSKSPQPETSQPQAAAQPPETIHAHSSEQDAAEAPAPEAHSERATEQTAPPHTFDAGDDGEDDDDGDDDEDEEPVEVQQPAEQPALQQHKRPQTPAQQEPEQDFAEVSADAVEVQAAPEAAEVSEQPQQADSVPAQAAPEQQQSGGLAEAEPQATSAASQVCHIPSLQEPLP